MLFLKHHFAPVYFNACRVFSNAYFFCPPFIASRHQAKKSLLTCRPLSWHQDGAMHHSRRDPVLFVTPLHPQTLQLSAKWTDASSDNPMAHLPRRKRGGPCPRHKDSLHHVSWGLWGWFWHTLPGLLHSPRKFHLASRGHEPAGDTASSPPKVRS